MIEEELNILKNHVEKTKDSKEPIVLLYKLVLELSEKDDRNKSS